MGVIGKCNQATSLLEFTWLTSGSFTAISSTADVAVLCFCPGALIRVVGHWVMRDSSQSETHEIGCFGP